MCRGATRIDEMQRRPQELANKGLQAQTATPSPDTRWMHLLQASVTIRQRRRNLTSRRISSGLPEHAESRRVRFHWIFLVAPGTQGPLAQPICRYADTRRRAAAVSSGVQHGLS